MASAVNVRTDYFMRLPSVLFFYSIHSDSGTPVTGSKLVLINYMQNIVKHVRFELLDNALIAQWWFDLNNFCDVLEERV